MAFARRRAFGEHPVFWRRAAPLAAIVVLHVGLYVALRDGLRQPVQDAEPARLVRVRLLGATPATSRPLTPPVSAAPSVPPRPPTAVPARRTRPARKPTLRSAAAATPTLTPLPTPAGVPVPTTNAPEASPASPPAPTALAAPVPQTITSGVTYLRPPRPDYPAQSRRAGEEGRVVLRVLIDELGHAERIVVQQSSGFARLDDAARDAVQQALFSPHREAGRAVAVYAVVPISFRLER